MDNNWSAEDNWLGTPAQQVELLMCEPHTYMPKKDLPGKLQAVAATLERREDVAATFGAVAADVAATFGAVAATLELWRPLKEKHVHSRQWVTCELLVRYW